MARCTSTGRAERDVSGSRSLRTTTYEIPCRARVSARPADGRPAANSRCTESSARMVCGGVSGIESRTPHGAARRAPAAARRGCRPTPGWRTVRRAPPAPGRRCCVRRASRRCRASTAGSRRRRPGGVSRPVQASDVAAASATRTTMPTATRLSRFGVGERVRSTPRAARCPAAGCGPSRCASPSAIGNRSSGSSLCMFRSGVPSASRNA